MKKFALPVVCAVALSCLNVPAAHAQEPEALPTQAACAHPGLKVESGTMDWGIKQSWRKYVTGNIARGKWQASSNVTQVGSPKDANFVFRMPIAADQTRILLNSDNTVNAADIATVPLAIRFDGHKGALQSTVISPYFHATADKAYPGTNYVGYYVPGKSMTEYTPNDRVAANRVEGRDTFGAGTANWQRSGNTLTLKTSGTKVTPKPGTKAQGKDLTVEGVDIVFMGIYHEGYNPELDDATITLTVSDTCWSEAEAAEIKKADSGFYAVGRGEASRLSPETAALLDSFQPFGEAPKPQQPNPNNPSTTATTTVTTTVTTTQVPPTHKNKSSSGSSSLGKRTEDDYKEGFASIRDVWSSILAVIATLGLVGVLGKLLYDGVKMFQPNR
ncbi:MAG: HtaA domain-containing protein [Corynebacterium sp.]|uniref:HtaA domain-containing protein n=1 Tax=Corynebacterium sp. TaxID=1720 RepID=UPI0026DC95C6|nr:HtaA domain-containing protein [Corynebacterium sp.]MDO5099758.1 HtaA domain-containing protein [Corynebacterium sp.]